VRFYITDQAGLIVAPISTASSLSTEWTLVTALYQSTTATTDILFGVLFSCMALRVTGEVFYFDDIVFEAA
jgi:hypothetical protein